MKSSSPFYNAFDETRGAKSDGDLKPDSSTDSVTRIRAGFDADKCVCCTVEKDQVLVHSGGGKGFGVGALGISSGCYQWKVKICNNISLEFETKQVRNLASRL